ncbi:cation:proton antiporter [Microbacterium pseudoresistens]|uniref:CPA1 family monovalent cation:H+ antiporter n=1 Tax=Microbacterium pseudoresistens TaxID=640634 RepID=A0A7Y9JND9_9MICO|nr:sodium:proton antiporter [Microbacterium pseudoresistens]NYD54458.1 CPA1 family monovalent cation:H+ antiporter [Microbacterium pseudoresistens]
MDVEFFYVIVGAVAVSAFARWRGWPAPLLVTLVALLASFLPFIHEITIDGHVLLNLVLPPLLYSAALDVSFVNFKRSMPQIRRLGIGLVLVTTVAAGLVAWWIMPELTLPGALLLGAIVAPPDAVSAAAIGRKLGLPRRIMTVLSGESLINDATSLTLYRVFASIVAGAALTVWDGVWQFALAVGVGVIVGLVFGAAVHQLRIRVSDPVVISAVGLLAPFGAYAISEHLQGSGVLTVVAMGLYVGFHSPRTTYTTRQQEGPIWLSADFLLEAYVFAYIGLQFTRVLRDLGSESVLDVLSLAGAVLLVVLFVRPLFIFPSEAWGRMWAGRKRRLWERGLESGRIAAMAARGSDDPRRRTPPMTMAEYDRQAGPVLSWRDKAVISWSGMRGVVTLATALAAADLAALDAEASHAIVIAAFMVTVATLMLQGLTLPWLIRMLGLADDTTEDEEDERELAAVRARTKEAGKDYLRTKRDEWIEKHGREEIEQFDVFIRRLLRVESGTDKAQEAQDSLDPRKHQREFAEYMEHLSKGWIEVRRELLIAERDAGTLNEEVMRELIDAMDAEELALDTRGAFRGGSRV